MGLFGWDDDTFEVVFDEVGLSTPDTVETGEDFSVNADLRTMGGSDTYRVEDMQLYLETDNGTYFLDRQSPGVLVGGAIDRDLPFRFEVDGKRVEELTDRGIVSPDTTYRLQTYTIFQEFEGDKIDDYWDTSTEHIRFR